MGVGVPAAVAEADFHVLEDVAQGNAVGLKQAQVRVADEIRKRFPVGRAVGLAAVAGVEHGFQQAEQERAFKRVAERNVAVLAGQVVQHGQQSPAVREGHRDVELRGGDGGGGWGEPTGGREREPF